MGENVISISPQASFDVSAVVVDDDVVLVFFCWGLVGVRFSLGFRATLILL